MRRLLFLGAPIFQIPIIEKAKEMGLYVGVIDIDSDAPAKKYADYCYDASITDYEEVLSIANEFKPDGIICGACDTSVVTCAKVCEILGLPGNSVDTAKKSTDKLQMLYAFSEYNVPHPNFQFIAKTEIHTFDLKIAYPVIAKPVDSAGGRGINFIENEQELYEKVLDSSRAGKSGDILIEEFMDGPEVSVEIIVIDGIPNVLQITDKVTSGEPYFYEIGHSQPSDLPVQMKNRISKVAKDACMAVGLMNSPAHVEVKITKEGPKLVELGARMGGDCITTYLINTSVSGMNMAEAAIQISLGSHDILKKYTDSGVYSAIKFIPSTTGILKDINTDKVENRNDIVAMNITAAKGKTYSSARDDTGRFGYVVAKGATKAEAFANCQVAIDAIEIIMEEE